MAIKKTNTIISPLFSPNPFLILLGCWGFWLFVVAPLLVSEVVLSFSPFPFLANGISYVLAIMLGVLVLSYFKAEEVRFWDARIFLNKERRKKLNTGAMINIYRKNSFDFFIYFGVSVFNWYLVVKTLFVY